ncbi:MAG: hypothetical protein M1835_006896 [Candelina submexicana]|nr:MAG: hypothetical protein M1835_006896 [Candelina submexicana]
MSDSAPQLDPIPTTEQSDVTYPRTHSSANGNSTMQNAKDNFVNSTYSAMESVQNHPYTQNVKQTVSNGKMYYSITSPPNGEAWLNRNTGPVAENVKNQSAKTSNEFSNLANARTRPNQQTATGQPLTHYHSMFYSLLSWENPRATGISFATSVLLIFLARYFPVLRYVFKGLSWVLTLTVVAELAGRAAFKQGLASSFRPRKYYTIPRELLERMLEDVEQLINFFVIEFQRILFAENLLHSAAALATSIISYWLIKFVPLWGLSLIATSVIYLVPLIYVNNREIIDHQIQRASEIVNSQATQVKDLAGHHTGRAVETAKAYAGDYSAKAQNYIGSARGRSGSPEVNSSSPPTSKPAKSYPNNDIAQEASDASYKSSDFPHAPRQEPTSNTTPIADQYRASAFGGEQGPMTS